MNVRYSDRWFTHTWMCNSKTHSQVLILFEFIIYPLGCLNHKFLEIRSFNNISNLEIQPLAKNFWWFSVEFWTGNNKLFYNCCLNVWKAGGYDDLLPFWPYFKEFWINNVHVIAMICNGVLKVPSPIASVFFQTYGDFGIRRKPIFFSLPLVNFTAEKCTVWKILMKMWLVM